MTNSNPRVDPANEETLIGTLQAILYDAFLNMDGMIPAEVVAYTQGPPALVQVQPLIKMVGTDGVSAARAQIAEVPVVNISSSGGVIHLPVKPKDTGWLFAGDRDIGLYIQNAKGSTSEQVEPNTNRTKRFSDGVFIPHALHSYSIATEDLNSLVLQSLDGMTKVVIGDDNKITLKATDIIIDSETATFTGSVEVEKGLKVSGLDPVVARFEGDVTASGSITPNVP